MAKVFGGDDGLVRDNSFLRKVAPLITVQELRDVYLFGLDIRDNNGNELPDSALQTYIDNAISMVEHYLDISIAPVENFKEYRDYHLNDYYQWGFYQLNNYPCICVRSINLVYFRDENAEPIAVQELPTNWIRLQAHDGIVRLIPNSRFPSRLQIGQGGTFFPEVLKNSFVPHAWEITYDYGFPTGKVPTLINQAIANIAAINALIIGGNLVLGAGIAGSSISLDGLAQSIQTTQSAENSAFSATIKDYGDRLYGKSKDDPFAILTILKNFYKGQEMNLLV